MRVDHLESLKSVVVVGRRDLFRLGLRVHRCMWYGVWYCFGCWDRRRFSNEWLDFALISHNSNIAIGISSVGDNLFATIWKINMVLSSRLVTITSLSVSKVAVSIVILGRNSPNS
jgi:hypothetical protein